VRTWTVSVITGSGAISGVFAVDAWDAALAHDQARELVAALNAGRVGEHRFCLISIVEREP
jgi:hypothetical protein